MKARNRFSVFLAFVLGVILFLERGVSWNCFSEDLFSEETAGMEMAVPEIITREEYEQNAYTARMEKYETDLNTLVFENADGNCVMRVFDYPVKYYDASGEVRDISLEMEEREDGKIQTADNSIITTFSEQLEDGIRLTNSKVDILMVPLVPTAVLRADNSDSALEREMNATLSESKKKVTYRYGKVSYEYALTYTGFKEEIVVEEYTNITDYSFELYTNGLKLKEVQGELYLFDGENAVATISDVIVFTADERNNRAFRLRYDIVEESQKYILTIHLDSEYLKDEKTAYPIRIDPTIEINYANSSSGIVDVTIAKNATFSIDSGSLYVGKRSSEGVSRILMKFPGLNLSTIAKSSQILSASVELRDLMCESTAMTVYCYAFDGNIWDSGSCNWNDVNADQYSNLLDSKSVSYSNGSTLATVHRYSFDITNAVIGWKSGSYNQNKGIMFKASSSIEGGTSNISKTFASYNRSAYQPSLTIVYTNPFVGYYGDTTMYQDASTYDSLQYRANCYGFALKMYYVPKQLPSIMEGCYLQQPGEFADKDLLPGISNNFSLISAYGKKMDNGGLTIDFMMNLIEADMMTMGYCILSTAKYTSSSHIPSADCANKRLILLVVQDEDFHFYMQNSNNTWSHKPGNTKAINTCNDHGIVLTNDNILQHMKEGPDAYPDYDKDYLFFYVDKPAQIDCGNTMGYNENSIYTPVYQVDNAGSVQNAAERIYQTSSVKYGRFDGKDDVDYYAFLATSSGSQTLDFSLSTKEATVINIFSSTSTSPIAWKYFDSGSGSITFSVTEGEMYYLCFDFAGDSTYSEQRIYNYSFSGN